MKHAITLWATLACCAAGAVEPPALEALRAAAETRLRSRPTGLHCGLERAPAGAGETGGRGVVLLVFPRSGDIGPAYTGCQSVFARSAAQPDRLVWLVEIERGQPVGLWANDPLLKDLLACRYREGQRIAGDERACPRAEELLLPSQPAGCFSASPEAGHCRFDRD